MVEKGAISATLAVNTVRKEGAIFAGEALKTAVTTAKFEGKTRATAKHLPNSSRTDWKEVGPRLKTALALIVHANNEETQKIAIEQAAELLNELRG